tara:strand:+ start:47134 stop:47298 length:165 start_codon:yes stop_codon:yes gene_type:complete
MNIIGVFARSYIDALTIAFTPLSRGEAGQPHRQHAFAARNNHFRSKESALARAA